MSYGDELTVSHRTPTLKLGSMYRPFPALPELDVVLADHASVQHPDSPDSPAALLHRFHDLRQRGAVVPVAFKDFVGEALPG